MHRYGDTLEFYALTIAEFLYLADHAKLDYADAAARFKAAGVRWITGGGSEILTEDFRRRHSKFKYTVAEYFAAQRALVDAGLQHLRHHGHRLRRNPRRAHRAPRTHPRLPGRKSASLGGGSASFLCWTFKPYFTQLGGIEITTSEYLRHLALSRIYLDNIPRIRTSVLTQNERALEGLLYGADDFDLPIEDEVTQTSRRHHQPRLRPPARPRPHTRLHPRIPPRSSPALEGGIVPERRNISGVWIRNLRRCRPHCLSYRPISAPLWS